jgi:hypothetical protein
MIDSGDATIFHRTDLLDDAFQFVIDSLTQFALDEQGAIL